MLLSGDDVLKLADLGSARVIRQNIIDSTLTRVGTSIYMSPEMFNLESYSINSENYSINSGNYSIYSKNYSFPTDIWYSSIIVFL